MKLLIILAILIGGIYGYSQTKQEIKKLEALSARTQVKKVDYRIVKLERFFRKFDSKLVVYAGDFVSVSDRYNLPYYLLPVVSCVESSCGKYYRFNVFGWGSDTIDFGNDLADLEMVAGKIAALPYYETYRKTHSIRDFAQAYNRPFAGEYESKLEWFKEEL